MRILELLKQRLISNALTHLYRDAAKRPLTIDFDPGAEKLVCVSDLHRGKRDGADDFRRTERVYNAALAWYHSEGYRLAILGDAEDLWECSPKQILGCTDQAATVGYARSLALEKRFNQNAQRYLRVYGNHDRLWASKRARKWLRPHLGDVDVRGAFAIRVCGQCDDLGPDPPMIMLTHGDAGTLDSAVFAPVSRVSSPLLGVLPRANWRSHGRSRGRLGAEGEAGQMAVSMGRATAAWRAPDHRTHAPPRVRHAHSAA